MNNMHLPTSSRSTATAWNFPLGIEGFRYADLNRVRRLMSLYQAFCDGLRAADPALAERAACAELLLDDWASSGQVDRRLSAELWQLPQQVDASSMTRHTESDPARGELERASGDGTELAGVSRGHAPKAAAERELFDAFEQAYASKLAVEPSGPLADWLAWGRGHAR
jgi:hypothetical protein